MKTHDGGYWGPLTGLMVGSVLGAAAGIILAPRCGKELRSDIREKAGKALDETRRFYTGSCARVKDTIGSIVGSREKDSVSTESPEEMAFDA